MSCSIRGRRPRVLVVNKLYPPVVGGVEKVAQDIVDELAGSIDFHVLVCQTKGRRSIQRQGRVTIERCASWGTARSVPLSIDFMSRYRQLAPQFDLVHFHEPFPLGALAGALFGFRRGVVTFHSEVVRQKILKHLYLPVLDRLLKRCAVIMPTSPNLGRHATALQKFSEKLRPVPLGIETSSLFAVGNNVGEMKGIRQKLSSKCMFLAVGRCVGYKGFEVLIDALSKLSYGDLVIVGDGPLRSALEKRAKDRGVDRRVHFAGQLSDRELALHFHACDVFVFPSVMGTEAFGLAQLEAMACGKPVINTDLPTGVPYVSLHGETGITVPVGRVDALADAMRQLYGNTSLRKVLGRNAKRRFLENFQRSQMAERVLAVYREVLSDELGQLPVIKSRGELAA